MNDSNVALVYPGGNSKKVLTEEATYNTLGFSFSTRKKWLILTSIFIVQISMNFNAAIYANAVAGMAAEFGITSFQARLGQMAFLVAYAFGCELWAPWSEEIGRKWVLQGSLCLVNLWQIPCALASNWGTVLGFRALGGLSSAGGSVTLGMVADMWEPEEQQYAVNFVVLSSCAGSVVAPIVGGFIQHCLSWRWVFWISLIFGFVAQAIHSFVPETRTSILLDKEAKYRRKQGIEQVWGPNEIRGSFWKRTSFKECAMLMWRPYKFLATEPIVAFLSLLSGFSDALIFTGLDSFSIVLDKWNFGIIAKGLAFIPLLIGYLIGYLSFLPVYRRDRKMIKNNPKAFKPERRLWWLLFLVVLEPIGLMGFAWSSLGPPHVHWIAPLIFTALIGIANLAIYQATIDYMVAAYGPYSASATGGNGFCRDFLAGIAALYATPLYENIAHGTKYQQVYPTLILFGIGVVLAVPVYVFYYFGWWFRKHSPYAQQLEHERDDKRGQREEAITRSRDNTPGNSRPVSRANSPTRSEKEADVEARPVLEVPASNGGLVV